MTDKKNLQTSYGTYLAIVSENGNVEKYDGKRIWVFCPHCYTKIEWVVKNKPPKYCLACSRGLRTRLVIGEG